MLYMTRIRSVERKGDDNREVRNAGATRCGNVWRLGRGRRHSVLRTAHVEQNASLPSMA